MENMAKAGLRSLVLALIILSASAAAEGDYNYNNVNNQPPNQKAMCYSDCGYKYGQSGAQYTACKNACNRGVNPSFDNPPTTTTAPPSSPAQPNCPKPDNYCDTKKGESCSNCPRDCDCYDLMCMPGKVGATSWGCFNPCLAVDNSVLNKEKQTCDCKSGYTLNKQETDCVPLGCPPNSKMNADGKCGCDDGYSNCDGNEDNGCEDRVSDDARNCGECGAACMDNAVCAKGECQCKPGYEKNSGFFMDECVQKCPDNSHMGDDKKCACDEGYMSDKKIGKCVKQNACNDNDECEPNLGENCAGCDACRCGQDNACDDAIADGLKTFPKVTDMRGCKDCEQYCRTYKEHMVFRDSDGKDCFCDCQPGYDWSEEEGKCVSVKPQLNKTLKKLNAAQASNITPCDFIQYLQNVEDKNKDKDWKQIITKMHRNQYGYDESLKVLVPGLYTTVEGSENKGFEDTDRATPST